MTADWKTDAQKIVAWLSILSFAFCIAAIYSIIAAVEFDASLGYLPIEAIPVAKPRLIFAWGIFDFAGYYFLRAPLILFLWHWFRPKNPLLVDFATFCGLLFIVLSVTAASVMTGVTMGVLAVYGDADPAMQVALGGAWEASIATVRQGLWQFSMVPWLVWTWMMGGWLAQSERWLGRALQSIGVAATISAIDPFFGPEIEASLSPVHDYQVHFSSIWMLWAGIVLLRRDSLLAKH
ncbi:MAG: hypothetical protein AB8G23_05450 [Myxococcota bacterium]